ncbi:hypothetical protein [Sphingobacterium spiritivorum]|uniref:hypothetical protein n=1 Tax=Sphingobacterium spiritivorum TaxID=258 RepID=UPI003DA45907
MEIIITWQTALFILAVYFATKYLYDTLLKIAAGCHDPFNPFYSYRDYPTWAKGYNRGRSEMLKAVMKIIAEVEAKQVRKMKKYNIPLGNGKHAAQDEPETEPAK